MTYIKRNGPVEEPVTVEEAKNILGIDFDWKDAEIEQLVSAAREHAESYTGLSIAAKTIDVYFDRPVYSFEAPCPPLLELVKVTAYDTQGQEKEISVADFDVFSMGREPGIIEAKRSNVYPDDLRARRALAFEIRAGFTREQCPAAFKDAIKFYIQSAYFGTPFAEWQGSFQALLFAWGRVNV